jgi:hypothetical protein
VLPFAIKILKKKDLFEKLTQLGHRRFQWKCRKNKNLLRGKGWREQNDGGCWKVKVLFRFPFSNPDLALHRQLVASHVYRKEAKIKCLSVYCRLLGPNKKVKVALSRNSYLLVVVSVIITGSEQSQTHRQFAFCCDAAAISIFAFAASVSFRFCSVQPTRPKVDFSGGVLLNLFAHRGVGRMASYSGHFAAMLWPQNERNRRDRR